MQNGPFQGLILSHILYYSIIITDALTCEQHFNIVAGQSEGYCKYSYAVKWFNLEQCIIFYSEICFVHKILTCKVTGSYSCQINIVELREHTVI